MSDVTWPTTRSGRSEKYSVDRDTSWSVSTLAFDGGFRRGLHEHRLDLFELLLHLVLRLLSHLVLLVPHGRTSHSRGTAPRVQLACLLVGPPSAGTNSVEMTSRHPNDAMGIREAHPPFRMKIGRREHDPSGAALQDVPSPTPPAPRSGLGYVPRQLRLPGSWAGPTMRFGGGSTGHGRQRPPRAPRPIASHGPAGIRPGLSKLGPPVLRPGTVRPSPIIERLASTTPRSYRWSHPPATGRRRSCRSGPRTAVHPSRGYRSTNRTTNPRSCSGTSRKRSTGSSRSPSGCSTRSPRRGARCPARWSRGWDPRSPR